MLYPENLFKKISLQIQFMSVLKVRHQIFYLVFNENAYLQFSITLYVKFYF